MNQLTIRDVDLKGKRVLMRVDFNVPVKDGVMNVTVLSQNTASVIIASCIN